MTSNKSKIKPDNKPDNTDNKPDNTDNTDNNTDNKPDNKPDNKTKGQSRKYIVASRLKSLCDKCSISNHTLGMYIRAWHIMTPAYMIILMFYISKLLYRILIVYLLFLLIAFNYFKGCVLTVLEKELCGDTFTFIDPILEYNNIELNSKNRYNMSLIAAKLYLAITFTIYYYRFLYK